LRTTTLKYGEGGLITASNRHHVILLKYSRDRAVREAEGGMRYAFPPYVLIPCIPSHMVAELQFHRMRMEVKLLLQIGLMIFANIVVDQGNGYHQGHIALTVIIDNLK
jgi:hypothetical protein